MKIEKVSFSENEENQIFDALIERFDLTKSDIWTKHGQTIDFSINELIDVQSTLELYSEGNMESDTNAEIITHQSVIKFTCFFTDKEGNEVKAKMINTCGKCLEDRISNNYRI